MRVLLTHPPLTPAGAVTPHVGLCTLSSWLRAHGHEVRILDLDLEVRFHPCPDLAYRNLFVRSMRDFAPQVVGVTSMYSNSLQAEQLVREAKALDPDAMTVAGGSHFGALGCLSLQRIPELDYVITGESERALAALVGGVPPAEIPRLHYRSGGAVCENPSDGLMSLGDLPPMWSTLGPSTSIARYAATIPSSSARRISYVEAGRGCPFKCSFCATAPFWENRFRVKPVERIVDEIRFLHEEHGYNSFILVHDLLTVSRAFISQFCDAMLESRLAVEWMANSRTDSRLDGLLPKMKAAGCWKLFHGVESAVPRIQAAIDKHLPIDGVYDCIGSLNAHGIAATTSFVIGLPSETSAELSRTLNMGARLKLMGVETVQFHRLRQFPPSPLSRRRDKATFDLDSLRIEYPFLDVSESDVRAIEADPEFFSGYWLTDTPAASAPELAQIEMFFHHMVAIAPLTIAAASSTAGTTVVTTFCDTVAEAGAIRRERIDWDSGDLWGNWLELQPLLDRWIDKIAPVEGWRRRLLRALQAYEANRIAFVTGQPIVGAIATGREWTAFECPVDLSAALAALLAARPLDDTLIGDRIVVLSRHSDRGFAVYLVDRARRDHVIEGSADLLGIFSGN